MQRQTTWNNRVPTGSTHLLVYDAACGLGCWYQRLGVPRCIRLPVEMVSSELTYGFECYLEKSTRNWRLYRVFHTKYRYCHGKKKPLPHIFVRVSGIRHVG